jgi:MarR family transcriptional regulator, organic hydroperoxide resistance regulator
MRVKMDSFESLHLNKHLCFALYTATHAYVNHYSQHLSEVGLSYEQYLVMVLLWQHQQLSPEELANKLNLDNLSLMPIIQSLEQASLITSSYGNQNTSSVVVSLTVLGAEIQHKTSQIQQRMACETGLTQLEHIEFRETLDKLLDNFKTRVLRTDEWVKNLPADL